MGGKSNSQRSTRIDGIQVQDSVYGIPIPIGWGRNRATGHLVWQNGFHSVEVKTKLSGGKGGSPKSISYKYYADLILMIAEGPVAGVRAVYRDRAVYDNGSTTALAQAGLNLATGALGQAIWGYLETQYPAQALAYSQTAYAYAPDYQLNDSAALQNHSFEVDFAVQVAGLADANPADIVTDFLTNEGYGVPMWPAARIGDLTAYRTYCLAQGLLLSPLLDQQNQASDVLTEWMQASNSEMFFSEGVLKIAPYGDASVSGNGASYVPALEPQYDLDDDDFIVQSPGDDPVSCDSSNLTDIYNVVQVEFLNRDHQYNVETTQAQDQVSIEQYGMRVQDPVTMHSICDPAVARLAAQLLLQRTRYIVNTYTFSLPWSFARLEPMDLVTITDARLGLARRLVRIKEIDEDDTGKLTLQAEDTFVGIASAPVYPVQSADGFIVDYTEDPGSISTPLLINPPAGIVLGDNGALTAAPAGQYVVWAAIAGTSPNWGGCDVWVSADGNNYQNVGTVTAASRYGVTTADFPGASDPDTTDILAVDLSASDGALASASQADADAAATPCWLGGEIVAYRDATLTGSFRYNLGYIRRGLYGTGIEDHPIDTSFARLDAAIFQYTYTSEQAGKSVSVKFTSFNVFGQQEENLADVAAYTITLDPQIAAPTEVTGLTLQAPFQGTYFTLNWNPATGAALYRVQVYESNGTSLLRQVSTTSTTFTYQLQDAQTDGDVERSYVVKVIASNGAGDAPPASITVTNPAPAAVTGVGKTGSGGSVTVSWTANTEADLAGYLAYYSQTIGFDPTLGQGAEFYSGPLTQATLSGLTTGQTYYVRVAAYDTWSSSPAQLNFSTQFGFTA